MRFSPSTLRPAREIGRERLCDAVRALPLNVKAVLRYSVKKNVGGVPQQIRRLSRLNIAQWRCGDQLGETVKSRVSHQPPGFRMGKNTRVFYPPTNAERANGC